MSRLGGGRHDQRPGARDKLADLGEQLTTLYKLSNSDDAGIVALTSLQTTTKTDSHGPPRCTARRTSRTINDDTCRAPIENRPRIGANHGSWPLRLNAINLLARLYGTCEADDYKELYMTSPLRMDGLTQRRQRAAF